MSPWSTARALLAGAVATALLLSAGCDLDTTAAVGPADSVVREPTAPPPPEGSDRLRWCEAHVTLGLIAVDVFADFEPEPGDRRSMRAALEAFYSREDVQDLQQETLETAPAEIADDTAVLVELTADGAAPLRDPEFMEAHARVEDFHDRRCTDVRRPVRAPTPPPPRS